MGIDINALKFLASAPQTGVNYARTVTIGRQRLYVTGDDIRRFVPNAAAEGQYCEPLLRALGAGQVDSVDVSDYEGATVLQDMNEPLPESRHGRYSAVVEAGTLEHIFNFPVAIRNCMSLVEVGGHVLCYTVANNFCGHGFYQFSPELFYRVFSEDNGFRVERMIACDGFYESDWYQVARPESVGRRVEISGPYPVMLLVQARRVASVPLFARHPQQSDYAAVWTGAVEQHPDHHSAAAAPRRKYSLRDLIPRKLAAKLRAIRSARQFSPGLFEKQSADGASAIRPPRKT